MAHCGSKKPAPHAPAPVTLPQQMVQDIATDPSSSQDPQQMVQKSPTQGSSRTGSSDDPPAVGIARVRQLVLKVLQHHDFDHGMGAVIMFNMLLIMVETDHAVVSDEPIPWVESAGKTILTIFVIELCLRLFAHGRSFFSDGWSVFDFFVVVTDTLCTLLGVILGSVFPTSTLRIFRLCKLARVSKVFRVFPELRIMMAGLMGSFRAIFWGTVLLAFVLLVWAIVAVQFIHPLMASLVHDDCERCPRAYASVLQATLTFSQQIVAGDNWGQMTVPVIEAYPWSAFFFMGVYLTIAVAVMNLILGVVVNIASSEHDRLEGELEEEKSIKKMCASNDILRICEQMDEDNDGLLSMEELKSFKHNAEFREAIEKLDLTQEDLTMAFSTMHADHTGAVSYPEFVQKIYKMTDSDSAFMLEQIKYLITQVKDIVIDNADRNQKQLVAFEEADIKVLEKIEQQEDAEKDLLGTLAQRANVHVISVDKGNKPDVDNPGSGIQEKESKWMDWPSVPEARLLPFSETAVETGSLELQIGASRSQLTKEVLDAMLQASSHLQVDFKVSLKHLAESILELHASRNRKPSRQFLNCQRLLPQAPESELGALPPGKVASGVEPANVEHC